jgi:hypothetical protein
MKKSEPLMEAGVELVGGIILCSTRFGNQGVRPEWVFLNQNGKAGRDRGNQQPIHNPKIKGLRPKPQPLDFTGAEGQNRTADTGIFRPAMAGTKT